METILEATYRGGVLVLDRSLGSDEEGKRFKLIVVEEVESAAKRERFFQFVKDHSFELPADYRFNRNEIYER